MVMWPMYGNEAKAWQQGQHMVMNLINSHKFIYSYRAVLNHNSGNTMS